MAIIVRLYGLPKIGPTLKVSEEDKKKYANKDQVGINIEKFCQDEITKINKFIANCDERINKLQEKISLNKQGWKKVGANCGFISFITIKIFFSTWWDNIKTEKSIKKLKSDQKTARDKIKNTEKFLEKYREEYEIFEKLGTGLFYV